MATKKNNNYINEELDWLEEKALEIKEFIDSTVYSDIEDRKIELMGARGYVEKLSATRESIQKSYRDAIKEYGLIIEVINNLREREEAKIQTRGKVELGYQAEAWIKSRNKE